MRMEISISEEAAGVLKKMAVQRYSSLRSTSRLIEDLVREAGSIPPPDVEAIKAEREEWIAEIIKEEQTRRKQKKGRICRNPPYWICDNCAAEFEVTIRSDAKYCPACRSNLIRIVAEKEKTIWSRIRDVVFADVYAKVDAEYQKGI